jgi:hypothetical protein
MILGTKATPVRFSFVQVWEPKAMEDNQPPKFSVQVIIPKSCTEMVEQVRAAITKATGLGIKKGLFNKAMTLNKDFRQPLRDGDQEAAEAEDGKRDYLKGCFFFNASAPMDRPPAVVDRFAKPIIRRDDFYSGCFGIIDVNFFPFKFGKGGVAAGLNSIMKREDGERLDGRIPPEEAFANVADDEANGDESSNSELV